MARAWFSMWNVYIKFEPDTFHSFENKKKVDKVKTKWQFWIMTLILFVVIVLL